MLTIEIYDQEGRLTNDEQDAACTVSFTHPETLPDEAQMLNADSVAINGTITFAQLNIRQYPDSNTSMSIEFSNLETFGNTVDAVLAPPPLVINARACADGESYGQLLTCLPCEPGYKLYQKQGKPGTCEQCLLEE